MTVQLDPEPAQQPAAEPAGQPQPEAAERPGQVQTSRRLLLVHAHPDDETIATGATMARYAAEGAQVTLVTCTLGEEGEVVVEDLAHLASDRDDSLGQHRIGELDGACVALGVRDQRFLGGAGRWRDSGMMGTAQNARPDCFWQADVDEAVAALVAVVREVRPQVVVTYDERGGYGHPDHIQAHRVAVAAFDAAADAAYRPDLGAPWAAAKLYYSAIPRSVLALALAAAQEAGTDFLGVDRVEDLPFGLPDELVTTEIDGRPHLAAKVEAMRSHRSQIRMEGSFFALADRVGMEAFGIEHYVQARGERSVSGTVGGTDRERDLFAGVRQT